MRTRRFEWGGAGRSAAAIRAWVAESAEPVDVAPIEGEVIERGDEAVLRADRPLRRHREPARDPARSIPRWRPRRWRRSTPSCARRSSVAAANVRAVAELQLGEHERAVELPQGQRVTVREVPLGAAGIYAPGGRAAYPSSVLMCAIPARVAGLSADRPRLARRAPTAACTRWCWRRRRCAGSRRSTRWAAPRRSSRSPTGPRAVAPVDLIAGPGNAWVREAKRRVYGVVGIDSLAGPSELMVVAGHDTDPEWVALDLCAQAEHGADSPLVLVAVEEHVLDAVAAATEARRGGAAERRRRALRDDRGPRPQRRRRSRQRLRPRAPAALRGGRGAARRARSRPPAASSPAATRATAFGDYVAGSNHVLPTGGAGRFSGPLGPAAFRRRIATVEIRRGRRRASWRRASDALARAEGFPVHAESAMIRR